MRVRCRRCGFTLLELMLAVALASMIIIPIGTLLVAATRESLFQRVIFGNETGAQLALNTIRNKVRESIYPDTMPMFGSSAGLLTLSDGSYITQRAGALVYVTNSTVYPLINEGVQSFGVNQDTNGVFQITLNVEPVSGQDTVMYKLGCSCRNY